MAAGEAPDSVADLLEDLLAAFPNERVSVGELIDKLESRAHGVLLLILALPMCLPNVPGISTVFGLLMLAPALQMMFGQRAMWLPRQMRAWSFPREGLCKALRAAIPSLRKIERLIKPRWPALTQWPATSLVGLQTLIMALILILPIWGANLTPGVTVVLTAMALLQRDGVLMLLTVPAALGSMAWVYFGAKYSIYALEWLIEWLRAFGAS